MLAVFSVFLSVQASNIFLQPSCALPALFSFVSPARASLLLAVPKHANFASAGSLESSISGLFLIFLWKYETLKASQQSLLLLQSSSKAGDCCLGFLGKLLRNKKYSSRHEQKWQLLRLYITFSVEKKNNLFLSRFLLSCDSLFQFFLLS